MNSINLRYNAYVWLALAAVLSAPLASAGVAPSIVKTCVDRNGGQLCMGDWVDCTLRVTAPGNEDFKIWDIIPGDFYDLWNITNAPAPNMPPFDCSRNEGQPLAVTNLLSQFCYNRVMMNNATYDFMYEARVRDDQCWSVGESHCGAAQWRDVNLNGGSSNSVCMVFDCLPPGPNTQLRKIWTGPGPRVGDPVTFTIEVENAGNGDDTVVRVTDTLDQTRFTAPMVSYSRPPDAGGLTGFDLDATWDVLMAGETVTITLSTFYANCTGSPPDGVCNQAFVTSTGLSASCAGGGPVGSDDPTTTSRFGDATCRTGTPGGSANIATPVKEMEDVNGPPLNVGDTVHVTVTFNNMAPCASQAGTFQDQLPPELTFVPGSITVTPASGTPSFVGPDTVRVDGFTVAGMSTTTIEFDATVNAVGIICNIAQYWFGISNPNDSSEACLGRVDDIDATKINSDPNGDGTVLRGQIFEYTISLFNNDPVNPVPDARVDDTIPSCFDFVAILADGGGSPVVMGQDVSITGINLPVSATPVDIIIQVQENGSCPIDDIVCNDALVNSSGTPMALPVSDSCLRIAASEVMITKMHSDPNGNNTVQPGETFEYTITITNNTSVDVDQLVFSDLIPDCFNIDAILDNGGGSDMVSGQQVDITNLTLTTVAPVTIVIQVTENGTCPLGDMPCNTANISGPAVPSMDSNDACIEIAIAGCSIVAEDPPLPVSRVAPWIYTNTCPTGDPTINPALSIFSLGSNSDMISTEPADTTGSALRFYQGDCGCSDLLYLSKTSSAPGGALHFWTR